VSLQHGRPRARNRVPSYFHRPPVHLPTPGNFPKRVVCITEVCGPRVLYKNWFLQFPAEKLPGRAYLEDAPSGSSPQVLRLASATRRLLGARDGARDVVASHSAIACGCWRSGGTGVPLDDRRGTGKCAVSGAPALVETKPSAISTLLDERAVGDLPLNGRRFSDLLLLSSGVTQDPRSLTSTTNGDLSVGGIRGFQNSFLVDGGDYSNAFFAQANFVTPRVQQSRLTLEKEVADHTTVSLALLNVHGEPLIRALDANLPPPGALTYLLFDSTGSIVRGGFYTVDSFATWQFTRSLTCPWPPCINPLGRPIAQLGAINEFQSAASG
jgi:hypothetical protein